MKNIMPCPKCGKELEIGEQGVGDFYVYCSCGYDKRKQRYVTKMTKGRET